MVFKKAFRLTRKLVPKKVFKPVFRRVAGRFGPTRKQIAHVAERIIKDVSVTGSQMLIEELKRTKEEMPGKDFLERAQKTLDEIQDKFTFQYSFSASITHVIAELGIKKDKRKLFDVTKDFIDRITDLKKTSIPARVALRDDMILGKSKQEILTILGTLQAEKFILLVAKKQVDTFQKLDAEINRIREQKRRLLEKHFNRQIEVDALLTQYANEVKRRTNP